MKVLVTGASGFSGHHMVRGLRENGFDVVAHARAKMGDLLDLYTLPDGCDAIVHCAASSALDGKTDEDLFRDNAKVTRHLAELAVHKKISHFIYFSSMSVYGDIIDPVVSESTPINNPNAYGRSKYEGEVALQGLAEKLPSVALRLPGVLGQGAHRHWLASVAQKLMEGEAVTIFNPEAPFNNGVHLNDISALVAGLLRQDLSGHQALVLGATDTISVKEVVLTLKESLKSPSQIRVEESDKTSFHIDSSRAIKEFGYCPMGMADMLVQYSTDLKVSYV